MVTEDLLKNIVNLFEENIPSSITYDAYNSGTLDLTDQLDEFEACLMQLLGFDEFAPETVTSGKSYIAEVVALAKKDEGIGRKEFLIELLEIFGDRLDEL